MVIQKEAERCGGCGHPQYTHEKKECFHTGTSKEMNIFGEEKEYFFRDCGCKKFNKIKIVGIQEGVKLPSCRTIK